MPLNIAVIGAGVIGLSTALCLKQSFPNLNVRILSKTTSPDTCSNVAAGIWEPFILRDTPMELQLKWSKATWDLTTRLMRRHDSNEIGISTCSGYNLFDSEQAELPSWRNLVPSMRKLSDTEMQEFPEKYKSGFFFTTSLIEPSQYLPWLLKCFYDLGGETKCKDVEYFDQLADYDLVINCTGFGARQLCSDLAVEPVRGQVLRVKAPWVKHFYLCELLEEQSVAYIIPNTDSIVLGGTVQQGNFSTDVNEDDRQHILRETQLILPSLVNSVEIADSVGLRPSRSSIRLEAEDFMLQSRNSKKRILKIIHNYGHGGAGLTTHWGCAMDVVHLAQQTIRDFHQNEAKAKL